MNKTIKGIEGDSSIFWNVKASRGRWEPDISKDLVNITPEPQTEHTLEERATDSVWKVYRRL